jgi:hypothetical protein
MSITAEYFPPVGQLAQKYVRYVGLVQVGLKLLRRKPSTITQTSGRLRCVKGLHYQRFPPAINPQSKKGANKRTLQGLPLFFATLAVPIEF